LTQSPGGVPRLAYFLPLPGVFFAGFLAGALLGFFGGALDGFFSGTFTGKTEH